MAWTKYGPLTGAGYQVLAGPTTGLVRMFLNDLSGANFFGGATTPQRYGQTAWIAPYDEVVTGDGIDDAGKYVGPVLWLQTEFVEQDWTQFNTAIAGITGFAYNVLTNNELTLYTFF